MKNQFRADDERVAAFGVASLGLGAMHLACVALLWLPCSRVALATCLICFVVRIFGITAGFHRYFAHRAYRTGRVFQFILAWLGTAAAQRGPLWWAAHHRQHHRHADTSLDIHSPVVRSFWWAHVGWILCRKYDVADLRFVKDWLRYPELRWLDRHFLVPPTVLAIGIALVGWLMERFAPSLRTSPLQLLLYGFALSTVAAYHCTFAVNSVAHRFGRRRFETDDDSRNNWLVALFTLGEGWHNNHHDYPAAERHGVSWWEVDVTHYALALLARIGIVWNVRARPARTYAADGPRVPGAVSLEAPPGTVAREPGHAGGTRWPRGAGEVK